MIASTIAILLFASVMLLIVGIDAEYSEGSFTVIVKLGPKQTRVFPPVDREKKPTKKDTPPEPDKSKDEKKAKPRLALPSREVLMDCVYAAFHTLGRFWQQLSVDVLILDYTAASDDPYDAVVQYGRVSTAIHAVLPVMMNAVKIREHSVVTRIDFDLKSPSVHFRLAASFAVWEILYIALALLYEIANSLYRNR